MNNSNACKVDYQFLFLLLSQYGHPNDVYNVIDQLWNIAGIPSDRDDRSRKIAAFKLTKRLKNDKVPDITLPWRAAIDLVQYRSVVINQGEVILPLELTNWILGFCNKEILLNPPVKSSLIKHDVKIDLLVTHILSLKQKWQGIYRSLKSTKCKINDINLAITCFPPCMSKLVANLNAEYIRLNRSDTILTDFAYD
ncbi:hypothetical protein ACOME3_002622 [Neoechinorhynchus agilis]